MPSIYRNRVFLNLFQTVYATLRKGHPITCHSKQREEIFLASALDTRAKGGQCHIVAALPMRHSPVPNVEKAAWAPWPIRTGTLKSHYIQTRLSGLRTLLLCYKFPYSYKTSSNFNLKFNHLKCGKHFVEH